MAKRVPQSPDVEDATAAFKRFSLGAPTTQLRTHSAGPSFRSGSAFSPGMAARRNKPLFKLSDITGEQESGGGAAGAGPAVGVPDETEWPPRRSVAVTSTPFANFGKIVYALLVMVELFSPHFFSVIRLARSTSAAKQSYTLRVLTFPMAPLLLSTWINSSSAKSSVTVPTVLSSELFTDPPKQRWR
jgi:hypothetical protein